MFLVITDVDIKLRKVSWYKILSEYKDCIYIIYFVKFERNDCL